MVVVCYFVIPKSKILRSTRNFEEEESFNQNLRQRTSGLEAFPEMKQTLQISQKCYFFRVGLLTLSLFSRLPEQLLKKVGC